MTACQKIKREILLQAWENYKSNGDYELSKEEKGFLEAVKDGINDEKIDEQYGALVESDCHQDYESDFRSGDVETKLPSEYSRHYEAKEVAIKLSDGSWVGWTYFYGGGKHGDPESIDWMEDAYNLEVTETEKLVVVREFKKK